ncbi:hypothetical protein [Zoogloea ramigera]|uniref:hypothetical protein n=1 Tax=Zoogloea ramigera TaxID=350 RepID=UPI003FA1B2EC
MFLPKRRLLIAATLSAAFLAACGGGGGSSAPAPLNVTAGAAGEPIFLKWDGLPPAQYLVWVKEGATVVVGDKTAVAKVGTKGNGVDSPYIFNIVRANTPLTNGTQYALVINGRKDGGEGGPGAVPVGGPVTPRLAGATWNAATPFASATMNGVAYGRSIGSTGRNSYVAVGDGGAVYNTPDTDDDRIYRSTNALNWTTPTGTKPDAAIDLKAVVYDASIGRYHAVGSNGTVVYSSDINNWTPLGSAATNTTETLNAIASSGGTLVAVGNKGTLRYSTNGTTWTTPASISEDISAIDLRGVTYNNGVWVAVGSNGKVLTSTSVGTWTVSTQSGDLTAVASGSHTLNSVTTYYYLAVGADGTVLTSTNGTAWTASNVGSALRTAAVGSRLIAMGDNGAVWYRELAGTTWAAGTGASGNMLGMIRAQNIYTAVGAAGASNHAY